MRLFYRLADTAPTYYYLLMLRDRGRLFILLRRHARWPKIPYGAASLLPTSPRRAMRHWFARQCFYASEAQRQQHSFRKIFD